jgi:hypothetical protein
LLRHQVVGKNVRSVYAGRHGGVLRDTGATARAEVRTSELADESADGFLRTDEGTKQHVLISAEVG